MTLGRESHKQKSQPPEKGQQRYLGLPDEQRHMVSLHSFLTISPKKQEVHISEGLPCAGALPGYQQMKITTHRCPRLLIFLLFCPWPAAQKPSPRRTVLRYKTGAGWE